MTLLPLRPYAEARAPAPLALAPAPPAVQRDGAASDDGAGCAP